MIDSYICFDIETTSDEVYSRTANYKYNEIICWSLKNQELDLTQYVHEETDLDLMLDLLLQYKTIVAFNAKFESLYLWKYERFQEWLQQGGQIYCPQLGEYLLSNHTTQWASLRELEVKYGIPERTKWIDVLFLKNSDTKYTSMQELPEDKVIEDNRNDTHGMEKIYLNQQKQILRRDKVFQKTIQIQMDMILSTTEIEDNGFAVNYQTLKTNQAELQQELQQTEKELQILIDKYWVIDDNA